LFAGRSEAVAAAGRAVSWNWLAPAFACGLAFLLAVNNSERRAGTLDERDVPAYFAAMGQPDGSPAFLLSKMDLNVEWNVWPRGIPWAGAARAAAAVAAPALDARLNLPFTNR
jgi:hypothetical protein